MYTAGNSDWQASSAGTGKRDPLQHQLDAPPPVLRPAPQRSTVDTELRWTKAMFVATGGLSVALLVRMAQSVAATAGRADWSALVGHLFFFALVSALLVGNIAYQVSRRGALLREARHRPAQSRTLDRVYATRAGTLTVLVPSYREDEAVVRQTLLSAALLDHPDRRVVLLLDDPPQPSDSEDVDALQRSRTLVRTIATLFDVPARRFAMEAESFERRRRRGRLVMSQEVARITTLHVEAARWFQEQRRREPVAGPTDALFTELCWTRREDELRQRARDWSESGTTTPVDLARAYDRLARTFSVEVSAFERKQYANLPHEPNKAMNLNAYLGLMGGHYRSRGLGEERSLVRCSAEEAELSVPDTTWVLTLDADSLLAHDYALRLIDKMVLPGAERVAVAQTPYSAVPHARGPVARVAGATTDIMFMVHQGTTAYGATFWVGANALLRKAALDDIMTLETERGHEVRRYVQDRTVIEDTESTIDLVSRGWSLYNYPSRLAYSATPPDYGSLLVQRRRWANGGLIILPKALRYAWRCRRSTAPGETFLRLHYLTSIATVNVALVLLMTVPLEDPLRTPALPLSCVPYFVLYARDLRRAGYRARDLVHVYALNLVLLPVNLGGVLKSLQQAITKRRIPFGRTPKIAARTAAPRLYVAATLLLLAHWSLALVWDLQEQRWAHATAVALNLGLLAWGMSQFIGWRPLLEDLTAGMKLFGVRRDDTSSGTRRTIVLPSPRPPADARLQPGLQQPVGTSTARGTVRAGGGRT